MPQCLDNRLTDGGKLVSPTYPPHFTPQKHYFYCFLLAIHNKKVNEPRIYYHLIFIINWKVCLDSVCWKYVSTGTDVGGPVTKQLPCW
jgi:hypothetical protein